jgi:hypothetical protein
VSIPIQIPYIESSKIIVECILKNDYGETKTDTTNIKLDKIKPKIVKVNYPIETEELNIQIEILAEDVLQNFPRDIKTPVRAIVARDNQLDLDRKFATTTKIDNEKKIWFSFAYDLPINCDSVDIYLAVSDFAGNLSEIEKCHIKINRITGDKIFSNYPNPFSECTTIQFKISKPTNKIYIFDIFGNLVKTILVEEPNKIGIQKVRWDGTNDYDEPVTNGGYVCPVEGNHIRIYVLR